MRGGEKVGRGISYGFVDQSDETYFTVSAVESHWTVLSRRETRFELGFTKVPPMVLWRMD